MRPGSGVVFLARFGIDSRYCMRAILPPLDTLDPADAWKPWRPTADNLWGRKWAAHLYRRAAFGGTRAELARAEKRGSRRHA